MAVNRGRVFLGGLVGGVVWNVWSVAVQFLIIGMGRYQAAQNAGLFLKQPRYPAFQLQWVVLLFILAIILAHLYAWVRQTLGAGPNTALKVGFLVGFAAGFPTNFGTATWAPIDRMVRWGGCWRCGWAQSWRRWLRGGCIRNSRARAWGIKESFSRKFS